MARNTEQFGLILQALGDAIGGTQNLQNQAAKERENRQALDLFREKLGIQQEFEEDFSSQLEKEIFKKRALKQAELQATTEFLKKSGLLGGTNGQQGQVGSIDTNSTGGISGFDTSINLGPITLKKKKSLDEEITREKALTKARKEGEMEVKQEDFKRVFDAFDVANQNIQQFRSAEGGLGRFFTGAGLFKEGILQQTPVGEDVEVFNKSKKLVRVKVQRAAGDVGNIAFQEQKAAEAILPNLSDTQRVADKKRTFILSLTNTMDDTGKVVDKKAARAIFKQIENDEDIGLKADKSRNIADTLAITPQQALQELLSRSQKGG